MKHRLYWSFGDPWEEDGWLITNFYYITGKHIELRLPWPVKTFNGAGNLNIRFDAGNAFSSDLSRENAQAGYTLYEHLGPEVQTALIQTFVNLPDQETDRVLFLRFSPPREHNREICLALENLPWEWLHDGKDRLARRYQFQIVRSHIQDVDYVPEKNVQLNSWNILLLTPFVNSTDEVYQNIGLVPLINGRKEVEQLRLLETQTHGNVHFSPRSQFQNKNFGLTTFQELKNILLNPQSPYYPFIHFIGHGVLYNGEPCLCFEDGSGAVDYITIDQIRKLFVKLQDKRGKDYLPSSIFINACGSSSRGRYSSGFASGLHDLGIGVLGYSSEIKDDEIPVIAAQTFYQSLCVDQALQKPNQKPNIIEAVGEARQQVRTYEDQHSSTGGNLRAYLPIDISFTVSGRNLIERMIQRLYTRWADWMNPMDYTDHLAIGFSFALIFGCIMGIQNLLFIFPESTRTQYLTYQEIVSELSRIFLVGPLSFLACSLPAAWQTRRNHQFLMRYNESMDWSKWTLFAITSLPVCLINGLIFTLLFSYSFARLEILTAQTVIVSTITNIPVPSFWYGFNVLLVICVTLSLWLTSIIHMARRKSLHSYRTYYVLLIMYMIIFLIDLSHLLIPHEIGEIRFIAWGMCIIAHSSAFAFTLTKALKETGWRASQKRQEPVGLSWRKLVPLLGGLLLAIVCYVLLEQTARFRAHYIHEALVERISDHEEPTENLQVVKVIERALRQRAVQDIPESVRQASQDDWLLSVVRADYLLYRAFNESEVEGQQILLSESLDYLHKAAELHPEVVFKDYYANIYAMVNMLRADRIHDPEKREQLFEDARQKAELAVHKDQFNFAYLDTLARLETRLGILRKDESLLLKALGHTKKAQWNAFFLRSDRADEVRDSIDDVTKMITERLIELRTNSQPSFSRNQ